MFDLSLVLRGLRVYESAWVKLLSIAAIESSLGLEKVKFLLLLLELLMRQCLIRSHIVVHNILHHIEGGHVLIRTLLRIVVIIICQIFNSFYV